MNISCQSIHLDCTCISYIYRSICYLRSVWLLPPHPFIVSFHLYTAVYPCGLCGYFHHTLSMYVQLIYRSIPLRSVWLPPPHTVSVSFHLYTVVYPCGLCGYFHHTLLMYVQLVYLCVVTSSHHTLPMYVQLVYRNIPLLSVWLLPPHTLSVCTICIPQHTPTVCVATFPVIAHIIHLYTAAYSVCGLCRPRT